MMIIAGLPNDENDIEEYERLLPPNWNPAIKPPEDDTQQTDPLILCEYCGLSEADTCIEFFMLPYLLCTNCVQLSIDDAHYAIGSI